MPDPLLLYDRLQREWPVIAGAPLSFIMAVLIVSFLLWLAMRWHYKALLTQKDEQLKTKDEQLAARGQVISEYRERQKDLPPQSQSHSQQWLIDLAESDRTSIDTVVQALECNVSWDLESPSPFVSFRFTVLNSSVWTIILNEVKGHILYGKMRLEREITISSEWKPTDIPHKYVGFLGIFQWLTEQEAETIRQDWNKGPRTFPSFDFTHLKIIASGGTNAEGVVPKPISLYRVPGARVRA